MHTISLHASNPHFREIVLKVIGQGQGHFKISKNGVPSKIFIYQPIHEKQNAYLSLHASSPHLRGNFGQGQGGGKWFAFCFSWIGW